MVQRSIDYLDTDYKDQPKSCFKAFLDVHLIVLSSYFQNWHVYLTVLSNNFEDLVCAEFHIKSVDLIPLPYICSHTICRLKWC